MHLIVGLSNPPKYDGTRHNFGQAVVSAFVAAHPELHPVNIPDFEGEAWRGKIGEQEVTAVPRLGTFMNTSGPVVARLLSFFKLTPNDLVLAHDEVALPLGTIRLGKDLSAANHNGVQSVIDALRTQDFVRLRLGIETRADLQIPPTIDYVLQRFTDEEQPILKTTIEHTEQALATFLKDGLAQAMNQHN